MKHIFRALLFAVMACFLTTGCSDGELQNVAGNASQEDLDNYNALLEQAEKEMEGDGEVEDLKE